MLEDYLDAISRTIQTSEHGVLASHIDDQILLASREEINLEKIIETALSKLHKHNFQITCAKNIDYLASQIDNAKIFDLTGIITSNEKAESILRNADIDSALRTIILS